jgi:uncharacterized protein with GYD domain
MYQCAYTSESWAAQTKNPQNRMDTVGTALCEAAGGKLIGAWLSFGDYDAVVIADRPNMESMAAVALAIASGGAVKSSKPTDLREPAGRQAMGRFRMRQTVFVASRALASPRKALYERSKRAPLGHGLLDVDPMTIGPIPAARGVWPSRGLGPRGERAEHLRCQRASLAYDVVPRRTTGFPPSARFTVPY